MDRLKKMIGKDFKESTWGKFNEKNYLKTAYHKYLIKESFYKAVTIRNGRTFMKIAELLDKEH